MSDGSPGGPRFPPADSAACRSGVVCRVKYCNSLPDIPFDPKFITYPFDQNRYAGGRAVKAAGFPPPGLLRSESGSRGCAGSCSTRPRLWRSSTNTTC